MAGTAARSPGTTSNPTDFDFVDADVINPTHSFDPDVTAPKEFETTIESDSDLEPDETFGFGLQNLVGAGDGTNTMITLTIQNDDGEKQ